MTDQTPATEAGQLFFDFLKHRKAGQWAEQIIAIEAEARASLDVRHSQHDYNAGVADGRASLDVDVLATDGLSALISDILRKYGGTMKGRGDHDIFDALVRYRAILAEQKP